MHTRSSVYVWMLLAFSVAPRLAPSPVAAAPIVEALYLENHVLPGADEIAGHLPTDLVRNNGQRPASVNVYGDFVATVHTKLGNFDSQNNTIYYHFGSLAGDAPAAIRREGTLAGVYQNIFNNGIGISPGGTTTYAASLGTGLSGPTSLWRDDTLIYQEGETIPTGPLAGKFFGGSTNSVFTRPDNESIWRMSYSDTSGGAATGAAFLRGLNSFEPILQSGDPIGDLGSIAFLGSPFVNPAYSLAGNHIVTAVELDTGDQILVINREPQTFASGGFLLDGALIPYADGGRTSDGMPTGEPIETLQISTNFAVNEAGDFAARASTELTNDGDTNSDDDILIYNGRILFREGDMIDGVTLNGQFEDVGINDRGDVVFGWNDRLYWWHEEKQPDGKLIVDVGDAVQLLDGQIGTLRRIGVSQLTVTNQVAADGDGLPVVYFGGSTLPSDLSALMRFVPQVSPSGDFDQDGMTSLVDYTAWRDSLGSPSYFHADADRDGNVGVADYQIWKDNYLPNVAGSSEQSSNAVPEPSLSVLLIPYLYLAFGIFRQRRLD